MFSHISLGVKDYQKTIKFYRETLKILFKDDTENVEEGIFEPAYQEGVLVYPGLKFFNFYSDEHFTGLTFEDLTYGVKDPLEHKDYGSPKGFHIAFKAKSKEDIDSWYKKALELGGTDNGPPGPRPMYGSDYYGAFVIDPSGYRIETCFLEQNGQS